MRARYGSKKRAEIREFVKTPFYRVLSSISLEEKNFDGEWKAVKGSKYFESLDLYKENGFKEKVKAEELIAYLSDGEPLTCTVTAIEKRKKKRIRHSFITWQSFRMNVPNDLRSVRMRHFGSFRNCMKRNW